MSTNLTVDKDWFLSTMRDRGTSLRKMAKHLEIDPSALSRALSGTRKIQMHEVQAMAEHLRLPVALILEKSGLDAGQIPQDAEIILTFQINKAGKLIEHDETLPLQYRIVDKAKTRLSSKTQVVAADISAIDGPLAFLDGATVLFRNVDEVEGQLNGEFCVVTLSDRSRHLARLLSIRPTGEASLEFPDGSKAKDRLQAASPVLALIP